jgi:hypothetical protein
VLAREAVPDVPQSQLLRDLRDLHPRGPIPEVTGDPRASARPFAPFPLEPAREAAQKACCGASAGLSGWTDELLFDALGEDAVAVDVVAMLTDIANGCITDPEVAASWASRRTPSAPVR